MPTGYNYKENQESAGKVLPGLEIDDNTVSMNGRKLTNKKAGFKIEKLQYKGNAVLNANRS